VSTFRQGTGEHTQKTKDSTSEQRTWGTLNKCGLN